MPAGRSAPARGAAVAAMLLLTMLARLPCLEAQSSRRPTVLTVDMTGKGDYRTIQEAIDAIPAAANNSTSAAIVTINVNPGQRQPWDIHGEGRCQQGWSLSSREERHLNHSYLEWTLEPEPPV